MFVIINHIISEILGKRNLDMNTLTLKDYQYTEINKGIILHNTEHFKPKHIFECGQCFRWVKEADESYSGVAFGKYLNVSETKDGVLFRNTNLEDFKSIWFEYFDLGSDYGEIKRKLQADPVMKQAIEFGWGIRLLRQELWEALLSFIISSNNIIPRIMKIVDTLSREFGEEIIQEDSRYHAFPEPKSLVDADVEKMSLCRAGYRCRYITEAARMVTFGEVRLNGMAGCSAEEIRKELMKVTGVGVKVADCTILYSGLRRDVFPTDVWIKRVVELLFLGKEADIREIHAFAREKFGEWSGIAQQYLFYYARENKLGTKTSLD